MLLVLLQFSLGQIFSLLPLCYVEAGKVEYSSLSEAEWKKRLTDNQYYITRQKGTERAFTGYVPFNDLCFRCYTVKLVSMKNFLEISRNKILFVIHKGIRYPVYSFMHS